jgi:hypothetical protein
MANALVQPELQKEIRSALINDGTISTQVGTDGNGNIQVYDRVPKTASEPYITIGEAAEERWGDASDAGSETQVTIHVWSKSTGRKEAKDILSRIREVLDRDESAISPSNHQVVALLYDFADTFSEPRGDATITHGVIRFTVTTHNT